jgi:hypothetical protein
VVTTIGMQNAFIVNPQRLRREPRYEELESPVVTCSVINLAVLAQETILFHVVNKTIAELRQ